MKQTYYWNYTIDDSNIWCWKIITVECPESWSDMPNHVYKSICELIADCPAIRQLEKDCVVDFFNEDWSRQYNPKVPKYLKLNSSWCIEWSPVDCPCEDEKVKAMACDNKAWYLIDKLIWHTSDDWLYSIKVEKDSCSAVWLTPTWPDNPYTREKNFPTTWTWDIKYKNWKIIYEPSLDPETWSNSSYAVWYHQGWTTIIPTEDWSTSWFKNSNTSVVDWYSFSNDSAPLLQWTKDIIKWKWKHLFWLTRPWVYVLSFNCCVKILKRAYTDKNESWARWVEAIRAWLILDSWNSKYVWRTVWDFKYHWENDILWAFPLKYLSFNSSYVLHIQTASTSSPVWICARVRTDTRTWFDNPPDSIAIVATNDWAYEPHSLLPVWSPNQWTNTTVTCCRVADYPSITEDLIEEP